MRMREAELHYYTYEEWLALDDPHPSELINGLIFLMAPAIRRHHDISNKLYDRFNDFIKVNGKPCKAYQSGIGVRLYADGDTLVIPDVVVVCDKKKLGNNGIEGAPDLVVEILSPSTARNDRLIKYREYLRAGVPEYWIVDPVHKTVELYSLDGNQYRQSVFSAEDTIESKALPGLSFPLEPVFED